MITVSVAFIPSMSKLLVQKLECHDVNMPLFWNGPREYCIVWVRASLLLAECCAENNFLH